jgi:uncharacterized protein YuzE
MVQVEYDKKADALYIGLRKATTDISAEAAQNVIIDLDKAGHIIGIEVLDVFKKSPELVNKLKKVKPTALKRLNLL